MLPAQRPRQNLQMREVLVQEIDQHERPLFVVDRDDEKARALGSGGAQEVEPGGVAVERRHAEAAEQFHLLLVVIEHGQAKAIRAQQAADDVPEAAEAGEDHGIVVLGNFIRGALRNARGEERLHEAFVCSQEEGRGRHAHGDGGDQEVG